MDLNGPWAWHKMPEETGRREALRKSIVGVLDRVPNSMADLSLYENRSGLAGDVEQHLEEDPAGTAGRADQFSRGTHYVTDKDGLIIAFTWSEERARLIAAVPAMLALLETEAKMAHRFKPPDPDANERGARPFGANPLWDGRFR